MFLPHPLHPVVTTPSEEETMPAVILVCLVIAGWVGVEALIALPLGAIELVKVPFWLLLTVIFIVFSWYFGE